VRCVSVCAVCVARGRLCAAHSHTHIHRASHPQDTPLEDEKQEDSVVKQQDVPSSGDGENKDETPEEMEVEEEQQQQEERGGPSWKFAWGGCVHYLEEGEEVRLCVCVCKCVCVCVCCAYVCVHAYVRLHVHQRPHAPTLYLMHAHTHAH